MSEQTRQGVARVSMILHQQNAQWFSWLWRSSRIHTAPFRALRHRVKRQLKCAAITPASAMHFNRAAVKIDEIFRNGQSQAKPAKLTSDGWISLLKRREERSLPLDFNSDPVIGNLKLKPTALVIRRAAVYLSAVRSPIHGLI